MQTMRQKRVRTLMALGFVAAMALTAGPAQAASGNGPYYAEPSWSQKLPAATRFVVLTDWNSEAVLDRNTGLVWDRYPQTGPVSFTDATFSCLNRAVGGQRGWRLPSIPELASLVDPGQINPALPPNHPFATILSTEYVSVTTLAGSSVFTPWVLDFINGRVTIPTDSNNLRVWCVRGGNSADAY